MPSKLLGWHLHSFAQNEGQNILTVALDLVREGRKTARGNERKYNQYQAKWMDIAPKNIPFPKSKKN